MTPIGKLEMLESLRRRWKDRVINDQTVRCEVIKIVHGDDAKGNNRTVTEEFLEDQIAQMREEVEDMDKVIGLWATPQPNNERGD